MYKGARYLLKDPIKIGITGEILNQGDITSTIPEREAKARPEFEPVYEGKQKKSKEEEK